MALKDLTESHASDLGAVKREWFSTDSDTDSNREICGSRWTLCFDLSLNEHAMKPAWF